MFGERKWSIFSREEYIRIWIEINNNRAWGGLVYDRCI